ncbi:MAG: transcription elongation factor GreA [Clostridia bacterium]|nr:transcription elongation factor GreA [Clostridia bacterium]MBR0387409.1 transcription elongation factor GreA [Clostridia bacterium]MBR2663806.1 transcription elongation factor GreA [Clostridia bacterium]MBR7174243.1 transcription elongation factor GreA [Clostridia bacterium]
MAEEKTTILTESGLKKLEEQLDYLISVRRNEVSEQIAIARGFGDLSENAEYDEAKKEQAKVEAEINRLQATIRTATVVADDEITTEKVSIGTIVKVKDVDEGDTVEYAIVGANEADPFENRISVDSPVGQGLLGAKKNQTVSILVPNGTIRYKIMSIRKN